MLETGGEGEIRTLAGCYPTNGLANRPLQPLGYLSAKDSISVALLDFSTQDLVFEIRVTI